jgi:hypothetical protein
MTALPPGRSVAHAAFPKGRGQAEAESRPVSARSIGLAIVTALCVAGAAFAGVVFALRATVPEQAETVGAPVAVMIGEVKLLVAASQIRVPEQRIGGALARIDLALDAATLAPAGFRAAESADLAGLIFVSLEPARDGGDPANRAEELYNRFLDADAVEAPDGLIKRSFKPKSPYNDEELYIAAPDGKAFAARCGPVNARSMPPTCLWQVRYGGLDVHIRFSPRHLPDWQRIAAGVFDTLSDMRKADGGARMP